MHITNTYKELISLELIHVNCIYADAQKRDSYRDFERIFILLNLWFLVYLFC